MAKQFLLFSKENSSMVSTWTDYLYCSILKNGSMSLRYNVKDEHGSEWSPSIKNIRTPKEFISAFESIERFENWSIQDLLPALHNHHPIFAIRLEYIQRYQELDDELESEINILLNKFMDGLTLDLPSGNANKRMFFNEVKKFVRDVLEETGEYPSGMHTINEILVDFPN